jgi:hypothetical protein
MSTGTTEDNLEISWSSEFKVQLFSNTAGNLEKEGKGQKKRANFRDRTLKISITNILHHF